SINGDLMDEVCNQVPEKALCFEILKNDSRSLSGKLEDFTKRAVEVAVNNATGLPDFVKSLANNATRPIIKSRILRITKLFSRNFICFNVWLKLPDQHFAYEEDAMERLLCHLQINLTLEFIFFRKYKLRHGGHTHIPMSKVL
nr:hypothetical protein [Tanacetum cinerariifolium]